MRSSTPDRPAPRCACAGRATRFSSKVIDDGRGPAAENGFAGGHGIAGMRERASLHGGSIQAGAGSVRGFAVWARLPLVQEQVQ